VLFEIKDATEIAKREETEVQRLKIGRRRVEQQSVFAKLCCIGQ